MRKVATTRLKKTKNTKTILKNKRILKPKYKLCGGPVFMFSLFGGSNSPLCPLSVTSPAMLYSLHKVSCPKSTATRYELVAQLSLW